MAGEIHVPEVFDKDAAAEHIVSAVLARWKALKPAEYAYWPTWCANYRKAQDDKGWTAETRELKVAFVIPQYVQLMVGRAVGDPSWNYREEKLLNAFLRLVPCSRIDPDVGTARSSVLNQADKDRTWTD